MDVQGSVAAGFEPVRQCLAESLAGQAGGYTIGFVTGTMRNFDRAEALENTLRDCLGVPPLSGTALSGTALLPPPSAS